MLLHISYNILKIYNHIIGHNSKDFPIKRMFLLEFEFFKNNDEALVVTKLKDIYILYDYDFNHWCFRKKPSFITRRSDILK